MPLKYVMCIVAIFVGIAAYAEEFSPAIREEHRIFVDGIEERWRLEWVSPPKPACPPDEPEWMTCPCNGFAFGERGNLVLVRQRPGSEEERFALDKLFEGDFDGPGQQGEAVLRRWDVYEKDIEESDSPDFASRVRTRPIATVMRFGDYDHDGRATEFLLQIGTLPCGKKMSLAIGVSRSTGRLNVLSTVEHPERPLVLQTSHWESLLKAKTPIRVVSWVCGDHGSDAETELDLSTDTNGIRATRTDYNCQPNGRRGKLVSKESL